MDVTCERCQAEYDFDESLLGGRGTTVKCAQCGHIFRVEPPGGQDRGKLKVRFKASGELLWLDSLRDLQRRVRAGEVGVDDELGREGFPWRRLGDVSELRNFFATRTATGTLRPSAGGGARPGLPINPASQPAPRSSTAAPSNEKTDTMRGPGPGKADRAALGDALNPAVPKAPRVPTLDSAAYNPDPATESTGVSERVGQGPQMHAAPKLPPAQDSASPPRAPSLAAASSQGPDSAWASQSARPSGGLYLAEEDERVELPRSSGSKMGLWALVMAVLAGALWVGMTVLGGESQKAADQELQEAPVAAAAPANVPAQEPAPPTNDAAQVAAPDPAPSDEPEATATAEQPVAEVEAPAETGPAAQGPAPEAKRPKARASSSAARGGGKRPLARDYGGLVAQGDKRLERGDTDGAMEAFRAALASRASGSEANTGMGYAMLDQGQVRQAVAYFRKAARNGYAEASLGLGDAHRKLGQKAEALKAYNQYLRRLPNGSKAHYAKAQIERLGPVEQPPAARAQPPAQAPANTPRAPSSDPFDDRPEPPAPPAPPTPPDTAAPTAQPPSTPQAPAPTAPTAPTVPTAEGSP